MFINLDLIPMIKVAIYTRVSTDSQAEVVFNSCDAQTTKIKAFISSQEDMQVHEVYSDAGYSGATMDRPALGRLLIAIRNSDVNMVIVYKIDRLTRSPKDFYTLIEVFEKYNVAFISVTERFDTSTPSGRLLRNIMLTFAQFERELTSERTKDKMLERAKKGFYGGGLCPFGYKRVDKKLVVEPGEADAVRRIFATYANTASLFQTYKTLKKEGVRNRNGKNFSQGDLAHILRRTLYTGTIQHVGHSYAGIHEPIVSEEQFRQAQEIHKRKVIPKWQPAKSFLFPGLVLCKECESVMTPTYINKIKETKRKRYYYYRCTCTLKRDWAACAIRQVSSTRLDEFIVQNLDRISKDRQHLESLSFMLNKDLPGVGKGFELSGQEPALTSRDIKKVLETVVRIASAKEAINKGMAIKNHVQNVVYSRDVVQIRLFARNAFAPSSDERLTEIPASAPLKMPPPIFSGAEAIMGVRGPKFLDEENFRKKEEAARLGFEPR